jgi:putative nucleotidyltransferase with HDIG domain
MERYQKIAQHKKFLKYIKKIKELEKEREFCCHGPEHLLDVARIAYLKALEENIPLSKDMIYGAALLHDIGKVKQYEKHIPHELAGAKKCGKILKECGYKKEEIEIIEQAILHHRRGGEPGSHPLERLLYEADKASRLCMFCKASEKCNWTKKEKNSIIAF